MRRDRTCLPAYFESGTFAERIATPEGRCTMGVRDGAVFASLLRRRLPRA